MKKTALGWNETRVRTTSAVNKPKAPVFLGYEQEPKSFNGLSN